MVLVVLAVDPGGREAGRGVDLELVSLVAFLTAPHDSTAVLELRMSLFRSLGAASAEAGAVVAASVPMVNAAARVPMVSARKIECWRARRVLPGRQCPRQYR